MKNTPEATNSSTGTAMNGATSPSGTTLANAKTAKSESIANPNANAVTNSAMSGSGALPVLLAPCLSSRVAFI